jgi:hypothetical protein
MFGREENCVQKPLTRKPEGKGLDLIIVREIILTL